MFSLPVYVLVLGLPVLYLFRLRLRSLFYPTAVTDDGPAVASSSTSSTTEPKPAKNIMQPARNDLLPPKDDLFTLEELRQYDGSNPDKPIYVSIKGAGPYVFLYQMSG